nr:MAG TPA: hypothetical protein [Bacteriophage sp.]
MYVCFRAYARQQSSFARPLLFRGRADDSSRPSRVRPVGDICVKRKLIATLLRASGIAGEY